MLKTNYWNNLKPHTLTACLSSMQVKTLSHFFMTNLYLYYLYDKLKSYFGLKSIYFMHFAMKFIFLVLEMWLDWLNNNQ